jgi:aminopeptidase N
MAPYLFFLGCGTYATFSQECEYANGHRFSLELLVSPTADPVIAKRALDIMHDAVIWVNLFTGPDRYGKPDVRSHLYQLVSELKRIKTTDPGSPRIPEIRAELKTLIDQIVPGYEYTGKIYREIAMQNSDYGGMENVGNTTITANRIMPYPTMIDPAYEYMAKVKVHEYYHNLNGSEVTGWSPFEIWLNEAVTVHIEDQFHAFHFGEDYARLETVISLLAPGSGTLEHDRGAAALPIEPDGFNDPNELITDITYKKAPEFVRMIETLMGKEVFVKGLEQYHQRYRHGNATREQWILSMEEASGQEFRSMAEGWLKQTGYPTLTVQTSYDADRRKMRVKLLQSGDAPDKLWTFPVRIALVSGSGNDMAEVLHRFDKVEDTLEIESSERPAFLSINRGFSFYGEVKHDVPLAELYLQVELDHDMINRFIAFMKIMDREKMSLLEDSDAQISQECTDLYYRLLSDNDLMTRSGGQFLAIFESAPDRRFTHHYQELHDMRERMLRSIATRHKEGLISIYHSHDRDDALMDTAERKPVAIKERQVKNTALAVLSRLDTPDIHRIIKEQFESSTSATDKLTAFSLYMDSSADDRSSMLETFERESEKNLVSWQNFLTAIAGNSSPQVMDMIAQVERSSAFRIEQANDQRGLYVRFAMNRKKSLQTEEGREFLQRSLLKLASINEYNTVAMLRVLGGLDEMKEEDQVPLVTMLKGLLRDLDPERTPSVYNNIRRLLAGASNAVRNQEKGRAG